MTTTIDDTDLTDLTDDTDTDATRCRWHRGLCARAYRDDDPTRCPFCHRRWSVILRTGHGCEIRTLWRPADQWRAAAAQDMAKLAQNRLQGCEQPQVQVDVLVGLCAPETGADGDGHA